MSKKKRNIWPNFLKNINILLNHNANKMKKITLKSVKRFNRIFVKMNHNTCMEKSTNLFHKVSQKKQKLSYEKMLKILFLISVVKSINNYWSLVILKFSMKKSIWDPMAQLIRGWETMKSFLKEKGLWLWGQFFTQLITKNTVPLSLSWINMENSSLIKTFYS